ICKSREFSRGILIQALLSVIAFVPGARCAVIAHVDVNVTPGGTWSYTIFNDEPANSAAFLAGFSLTIDAPVIVTGAPAGWDFSTDGISSVFWFNTDPALPYPHDVQPGSSLSGFSVSSPGAISEILDGEVVSWDHTLDAPGSISAGLAVLSPGTPSASVP